MCIRDSSSSLDRPRRHAPPILLPNPRSPWRRGWRSRRCRMRRPRATPRVRRSSYSTPASAVSPRGSGTRPHRGPALPNLVDAIVRRDRQRPRAEFGRRVGTIEPRVGPDESFLRRLLGLAGIAQHTVGEVIDRPLVCLDQLPERIFIAASGLLQPNLLIVQRSNLLC